MPQSPVLAWEHPSLQPDASPAGEWLDTNSNYKRLSEGGVK